VLLVVACVGVVLLYVARVEAYKDSKYDLWPGIALAAFLFVSFFADYSLRNGFQAQMRKRSLMSNRSKHAAISNRALEMMVPAFVVDRLMKNANGRKDFSETLSERQSATGSVVSDDKSSRSGRHINATAAHEFVAQRGERVWPYPSAVVMFVAFEPPALSYRVISDTISRIESVATWRSIQKVKTIGTTVLCVAGIDKSLGFEDAVANVLECSVEIERRVFPSAVSTGWTYRIGIHVGPCFGAVVGNQGLAFDIFGDTVNTASRMQTTAPPNTIQCTQQTQAVLASHTGLEVLFRPVARAVSVKGKGKLKTCFVFDKRTHTDDEETVAATLAKLGDGDEPMSEEGAVDDGRTSGKPAEARGLSSPRRSGATNIKALLAQRKWSDDDDDGVVGEHPLHVAE